jgi:hypothetical protein
VQHKKEQHEKEEPEFDVPPLIKGNPPGKRLGIAVVPGGLEAILTLGVPEEFKVDANSLKRAQHLTDALAAQIAGREPDEVVRAFLRAPESAEAVADLTAPLDQMPEKLLWRDVRADVQEFDLLLALARISNTNILALDMGSERTRVPVLPAHGVLIGLIKMSLIKDFQCEWVAELAQHLLQGALQETRERKVQLSWREAHTAFFEGLSTFLAARIAGVPWLTRQMDLPSPSGPPGPRGAGGRIPPRQQWTVHTKASGLSLYYGGTHAVRVPANYLAGLTTPNLRGEDPNLLVFLPMGTLYLAADAGPGGAIVWDDKSAVTVPSHRPDFYTKKF